MGTVEDVNLGTSFLILFAYAGDRKFAAPQVSSSSTSAAPAANATSGKGLGPM